MTLTPGRFLVDSLHFLEPTASADSEYRGLAGCQAIRPHAKGRWLPRKEIVLLHVFP